MVLVEVDEDSTSYYSDHIPTAVALDWRADLQHPLRRDFIDAQAFAALLSSKGIDSEDTVVLYGGKPHDASTNNRR